jgi:hypothetical protein
MNLKESIRIIIKEELTLPFHLRRRLDKFPNYVRATYKWLNPAAFKDFNDFLDRVISSSTRDFVAEYSIYTDDPSYYENYSKMVEDFRNVAKNILMKKYYDEIYNYYKSQRKGIDETVQKILKEEAKKDMLIDMYITSLIKPENEFKLKHFKDSIEILNKRDMIIAIIFYDVRKDKMEVMVFDKIYGMIYNMFSMDGLEEIQKYLIKWFQENFDGLENLDEVSTFDDEEYAYLHEIHYN